MMCVEWIDTVTYNETNLEKHNIKLASIYVTIYKKVPKIVDFFSANVQSFD